MKKIITILFAAFILFNTATAKIQNEKITYRVMYKWGLINKQAGTVTINTRLSSDNKTLMPHSWVILHLGQISFTA